MTQQIVFKGWVEVEPPASSTIHTWKGEGMTHILFVNDCAENGKIDDMRDIINRMPWVLNAQSLTMAMNNALQAGCEASIEVLLEYVDVLNLDALQWFLQVFSFTKPKWNSNHFKAMEMLRFQRPGFLEQIYSIEEKIDKSIYAHVAQYLEIFNVQEKLEQQTPKSGSADSSSFESFRI